MIIGVSAPCPVGEVVSVDFIDLQGVMHKNMPVFVLRTATQEEWADQYEDGCARLAMRLDQFPEATFYEVSID